MPAFVPGSTRAAVVVAGLPRFSSSAMSSLLHNLLVMEGEARRRQFEVPLAARVVDVLGIVNGGIGPGRPLRR